MITFLAIQKHIYFQCYTRIKKKNPIKHYINCKSNTEPILPINSFL